METELDPKVNQPTTTEQPPSPTPPPPDPLKPGTPGKSKKSLLIAGIVALVLLVGGAAAYMLMRPAPTDQSEQSISILWAEWPPADSLEELSKDFTAETGIKVNIVQEPWSNFQTLFFDEMEKKGQAYDMVVGDSQWIGKGAVDGSYVDITDWVGTTKLADSVTPEALSGYAEYPKGSKKYWAIPLEGDAMGFSYRKDLFESPTEKAAFLKKYGYELAVPKTWAQLRDIAEFFYRPTKDLYGVLMWTEPNYDGTTMGVDSLIWSWGADLGNAETYKVQGILNSQEGVDALKYYKALNQFSNPAWKDHYVGGEKNANKPMMDGQVAMGMGYFAIAPELLDKSLSPNADNIGFFASPAGPESRAVSLGGQGLSLVSYSKKKDLSLKFMEWIARDDIQAKWAEKGGLSFNKKVLASEAFLNQSPFNRAYVESVEFVRDFWTVPEYAELMAVSQKYWNQYLTTNTITAEQAMNSIAKEWEQIFEAAGYYKQ